MSRRSVAIRAAGVVLVASLLLASGYLGFRWVNRPTTVTALFASAAAIYPGDAVRVAGVRVGTVTAITPRADNVAFTLRVEHGVSVPADAKAVVVAQNLVSARYVQLTPAYLDAGPVLQDGATIPVERTAVPVEWDEVKTQLNRLATELGPQSDSNTGSAGRFLDSAANAMAGNGDKLRQTLAQLSGVARVLAEGGGDIVDVLKQLQVFVEALRDSGQQIVQFEGNLATLSSVLDGSRTDLDAALTNLVTALDDVHRFVAGTRDKTTEQVQRLANVTQTLVDQKKDVEQLLHIFPNSLVNFYNIYDPISGTEAGTFALNNFSNPIQFMCSALAATQPANPTDGVKKCAEYLGPLLRVFNPAALVNFNYLPVGINPFLAPVPRPDQMIYSEPGLIPGVVGPDGPPPPPTVDNILLPAERPTP
ncbi:MCE family protein [Mycobacterium sp. 48b]|uniref:MCE family protein n=1 Tax=Mycobacterium sp. 48b TaxID=3400426 RepID=UPI003AB0E4E1